MGGSRRGVDLLTTTASTLQKLLGSGSVTTGALVSLYLFQIEKHNHHGAKLNAMISTAPIENLKEWATTLDEERAAGKLRSPLHGIPIIVKDTIWTEASLGMDTTCGFYALKGVKAKKNAPVIQDLLDAGMIILGKANLTQLECAGRKGSPIPGGWSALGGQTQTRYIIGGLEQNDKWLGHSNVCGSSSGCAAGVAAGFAPLALATEVDGSLTQPSGRCSLYGLKVTVGTVNTDGTLPQSPFNDSLGPMAKTPEDLASLLSIIMKKDYSTFLKMSWTGLRVGFVDWTKWYVWEGPWYHVDAVMDQEFADLEKACQMIRENGGKVVNNVDVPTYAAFSFNGEDSLGQVLDHDFARYAGAFLEGLINPPVRSIKDVIEFNINNANLELPAGIYLHLSLGVLEADAFEVDMPYQQILEDSVKNLNLLSNEKYEEAKCEIRRVAWTDGFQRLFESHGIDIIAGPQDSQLGTIAAAAGLLSASAPLGYADSFNGRAYGLSLITGPGREDQIVAFMSAWEASQPQLRKPPPQLVEDRKAHSSI